MMFDYGGSSLTSESAAEKYIGELMNNFTVMIVAEKFDESLVVMKNKLCWDWSDIVYVKANVGNYNYGENTTLENKRRVLHQQFSPFDYILYNKSVTKLQNDIEKVENFDQQLQEFRRVNKHVVSWCEQKNLTNTSSFSMQTLFTNGGETFYDYMGCKRLKQYIIYYIDEMNESRRRGIH